tara:strand:- start:3160 stop:3687 length:528 start_codon:yes stop_codon:yes gene_type:complete
MNIFYLDKSPVQSARYQYNRHVVKMILESAQMLCTAHHEYGNGHNVPYKPAYVNHPSTKWCRQNVAQYKWLYIHFLALGREYELRYGKEHTTITKCRVALRSTPPNMPTTPFTQPPQCMPDQYKCSCSVKAYWRYYIAEKHTVAHKSEKIYKHSPLEKLQNLFIRAGRFFIAKPV